MKYEIVKEIKFPRRYSNSPVKILPFHYAFIRPERMPDIIFEKFYGPIIVIGSQGKGCAYSIVNGKLIRYKGDLYEKTTPKI